MNKKLRAGLSILVAALVTCSTSYAAERDPAVRKAFHRTHPCPETGKTTGKCPGYVVDHIRPLCAGGPDKVSNMQWQTVAAAKKKDRLERAECSSKKRRV